jgi:hypothetical protein
MADQRAVYTEYAVGASHPTLSDVINRLSLVEHNTDGTHKMTGGVAGDIFYHDGTSLIRLAKDVGKVLVSGAASVSWSNSIAGLTLTTATLTAPAINGAVTTTGLTMPAFAAGGTISGATGITSVGTITTGIWNATSISAIKGGTAIDSSGSTGTPLVSAGTWSIQALTNGQLIIGSTGVIPVAATLTAGAGASITNAAGSITIASSVGISSTLGHYEQDFMGDLIPDEFSTGLVGTGAVALLTGAGVNGGQVRLSMGATNPSSAILYLGTAAAGTDSLFDPDDNLTMTFEARVKWSNNALKALIGWSQDAAGRIDDTTDFCGFELAHAADHITGTTRKVGTSSNANDVDVLANTWYVLRCVYASGLVTFTVDGVAAGTTNDNLPLVDMVWQFGAYDTGNSYTATIDYFWVEWTRSASD